jgi:hypothetical protein
MFWKISPHFRDIYDFFIVDLRMTRYPLTRPQGRIAWRQCLSWGALKSLVVRHPKGPKVILLYCYSNGKIMLGFDDRLQLVPVSSKSCILMNRALQPSCWQLRCLAGLHPPILDTLQGV